MIATLEAEHTLERVAAAGVGTGSYPKDEQRKYLRKWEERARPRRRTAPSRPSDAEAAAIGIKVVRRPRKRKA